MRLSNALERKLLVGASVTEQQIREISEELSSLPFTQWVRRFVGVELEPGQRAIALVAYDGIAPAELDGAERELAKRIFGDVANVEPAQRFVACHVAGGRGGKSFALSALRALHLGFTVSLHTLGPGEQAWGLVVAPDIRLARQTLSFIVGAAQRLPPGLFVDATADQVRIRRPDGNAVTFGALPATRGGSAVRARSLVCAVLEECAFFRDASYKVNDLEIFRAVTPRILRGGQVIVPSTPYARAGLLYALYAKNWGHPVDALVAHAPTLVLRDNDDTREYVRRERERDPENARRECGAEFMSASDAQFFDELALEAAVDPSLVIPSPVIPGALVSVGGDWGFRQDSSTLCVVQRDGNRFEVSQLLEIIPAADKPLKPSEVVKTFAMSAKAYGAEQVVSDAHYEESIREHLHLESLHLVRCAEGANGKAEMYQRARALLNEGRVRLPRHERLLQQLREVVSRPTSGGGVSIQSPRRRGAGHGDLVSAFVTALWDAARREPGYEQAQKKVREDRYARIDEQVEMYRAAQRRRYDEESWSDGWYYEE